MTFKKPLLDTLVAQSLGDEHRLLALEAAVAELKEAVHAHTNEVNVRLLRLELRLLKGEAKEK